MTDLSRRVRALERVAPTTVGINPAVAGAFRLFHGRDLTAEEERALAREFPSWLSLLKHAQKPRPPDPGEPAPAPGEDLEAA